MTLRLHRPHPIPFLRAWLFLVLISVFGLSAVNATSTVAQEGPFPVRRGDPTVKVYDAAGILTKGEENSLQSDATRASTLGIDFLVYTRLTLDTPEQSQAFADRLRTEWKIESSPGADDGIVFLLAVDPSSSHASRVVVSVGPNALPIRQLSVEVFNRIVTDEMTPNLERGEFGMSLYYGTRRLLNFAEYTPPDPEPRTTTQKLLGGMGNVFAVGTVLVAIGGWFAAPMLLERRQTLRPARRTIVAYGLAVAAIAILTGLLGILGRSAFASLIALTAVIWAGGLLPLVAPVIMSSDPQDIETGGARA